MHLRAFVALAEELNYRRAAARLFVSQPALTAQINHLEHGIGVVLFDRGRGGTRLTAAGEDLLPGARQVLRAVDELVERTATWRGGLTLAQSGPRRVRIGVGPAGLGAATWPTMQALAARRPDLEPHAVPLSFSTALPALDRGDVEAVLVHGPVDEAAHREVATVGHVEVAVIVPTHHWLARRPSIEVDDVAPLLRVAPPPEMGEAFTRFWMLADHPQSSTAELRLRSEEMQEIAEEAGRTGVVGLWPGDVDVDPGSGSVVRPLSVPRLAPLQVVTRAGWPHGEDLVAAATASVSAVGGAPATTRDTEPGRGQHDQQD